MTVSKIAFRLARPACLLFFLSAFVSSSTGEEALRDTLPPLKEGKAPETYDELWNGFDPRVEPLDVEVLKEWEEDGVILKVIRYRIGVFKGKKAMMAAVYGYPKGGKDLPGLVQIHGGGQFADAKAVLTNGKRGYATISIAWAGRISSPEYRVSSNEVPLFWEGKKEDPRYRITTDWGAVDGYHAPSRNPKNQFPSIPSGDWTLDGIPSARNNSWFLCTIGARRALTFLEQQEEVDAEKLGVYGHSMGGKLTVLTAGSDDRVKASAPSCGGISDRYNDDPTFRRLLGDDVYLRRIDDPIIFLSPANDFHGRINDLQTALTEIKTEEWRVVCSPHHNHQDTAEYEVATQIWFDQQFKKGFSIPQTPGAGIATNDTGFRPYFEIRPDPSLPIVSVDVFYTHQGQEEGADDRENTIHRFWRHAPASKENGTWTSSLDVGGIENEAILERPLWIYANVTYRMAKTIEGAGYYYGIYEADEFVISSRMTMLPAGEWKTAGLAPSIGGYFQIEDFSEGWEKEWFTYRPEEWGMRSNKLSDPRWTAPEGASLRILFSDFQPEHSNILILGIDDYATEIRLEAGSSLTSVSLQPSDFTSATGEPLESWQGVRQLWFSGKETLRKRVDGKNVSRELGRSWKGAYPKFRSIEWEVEGVKILR